MKKFISLTLATTLSLATIGSAYAADAVAPAAPAAATTATAPATEPAPRGQGIYEDVVTTASVNIKASDVLAKSLGTAGTWITTVSGDVVCEKDLVWEGDVRKEGGTVPGRKFGIYYHSSPNIGGEQIYTVKVPNLIVKAAAANLAYGTLDGNVKVKAEKFKLTDCTITGNLEFDTKEMYDSASFNNVNIKGKVIVAGIVKSSKEKPQTIKNYGKYDASPVKSDMMAVAVTFKDAKPHDLYIDVNGADYFMKEGVLSSSAQGNWGKVAYSKAGQYVMVKPTEDRPADTILAWDKQMSTLMTEYKKSWDLTKFPTFARDASHPSALDFNKFADGKFKEYTVSTTNGALDVTKLKGAKRSEVAKADAITGVSVDVGKYLKLADSIVKAGTK